MYLIGFDLFLNKFASLIPDFVKEQRARKKQVLTGHHFEEFKILGAVM